MKKKMIIIGSIICLLVIGVYLWNLFKMPKEDKQLISDLLSILYEDPLNTPIDEIMNQDNEDKLFNLFIRIDEKSSYGEDFNHCTLEEKNYWFIYNFHYEVECGGVEQFISNNYENHTYALDILKELQLKNSAEYLQAGIQLYPDKRIELYSNQAISDLLSDIDEQFYLKHEEEYFHFIDDYVEQNKNQFK